MEPILATVNINIGLGKDNPVLTIRANDNLSNQIDKLISDFQLPKKVHALIMQRVQEELPAIPSPRQQRTSPLNRTPAAQNRSSVSPISKSILSKPSTAKLAIKKQAVVLKENNPHSGNESNQSTKPFLRKAGKSVSPIKKVNPGPPALKKVELRISKSPLKQDNLLRKQPSRLVKPNQPLKIQKLFRHLTRENPSDVHILTPEFINIKGLDHSLLNDLQHFFQLLDEAEFYLMDQAYFMKKVAELGFQVKFSRKESDYR